MAFNKELLDESEPVGSIPSSRKRNQTYQISPRKSVTVDGAFERSRGVRAADASGVRDLARRYTRAKEYHRELMTEFEKSKRKLQELKLALDSQIQDKTMSVESWLDKSSPESTEDGGHHQQTLIDYPPSDATYDVDVGGQSGFLQKPVPHQSRSRSPRRVFSGHAGDSSPILPTFFEQRSAKRPKKRRIMEEPSKEEIRNRRGSRDHDELEVNWRDSELRRFEQARLPTDEFTSDYGRSAIRISPKKRSTHTLIRPKSKSREVIDRYCSPTPEDAASADQRGKNSSGKPSSHSVTRGARKFTSPRTLVCPKNTSGEVTDSYCSPTQQEVVAAIRHGENTSGKHSGQTQGSPQTRSSASERPRGSNSVSRTRKEAASPAQQLNMNTPLKLAGRTQGSPQIRPSASERPQRIDSVSRARKEAASPAQQLNTNTPLKLAGKKTRRRNEELADITDQVNNSYSYDISDSRIPSTPNPKKSMLPRVTLSTHSEVPEKIPSHVKRRQTFEDNTEEEEPFSNDELPKERKDSHGFAKSPSRLANQQKGKAGRLTPNSRRE
ncbi:uncharacterized protein [Watersipora subatra]|uniref:uncharacterized protein n=1 Tax=Watersipora subatra TaxID=2589382 RepID=UPI00355B0D96